MTGELERTVEGDFRCAGGDEVYENPVTVELLYDLPYPRFYLDVEVISGDPMVWAGIYPLHQVPFAWSCGVETGLGEITNHGFLPDDSADPRRRFIETLVHTVGNTGPIFVWPGAFHHRAFPGTYSSLLL